MGKLHMCAVCQVDVHILAFSIVPFLSEPPLGVKLEFLGNAMLSDAK